MSCGEKPMSAPFGSLVVLLGLMGQTIVVGERDNDARGEQQQFLKSKAAELTLRKPAGEPLALVPQPVLSYSNAELAIGALDGAAFLWLDGRRPAAVVSHWINHPRNLVYRECTSLFEQPLECTRDGVPVWTPKSGGFAPRPLPDAPAPVASKPLRLTQMRELARRFSAAGYSSQTDEPTELRLLPQPLFRFADEAAGTVDGGLFAFVLSNDPEFFLLLEALNAPEEGSQWRFALARMSSRKHVVRLDGKEIWSVTNYYSEPRESRTTGPYCEGQLGPYLAADGPNQR
jgi:hypothetical protein